MKSKSQEGLKNFSRLIQKILTRKSADSWILIGPVAYLSIQFLLHSVGLRFDYWRSGPWQLIPPEVMASQPYESIWYLHIQPPGFNLSALILDRFNSFSPVIWQVFILIGTTIAIWMLSRIVWIWTNHKLPSILAGTLYGIMASTHLYSLWLFYTQPVAIMFTFLAWGLVQGRATGNWRYFLFSAFSVLSLFLWRSSVIWIMAILWILFLLYASRRTQSEKVSKVDKRLFVTCTILILLVGLLSLKNLVLFGSGSQSSWAPENMAKVILYSASDIELQEVAQKDPCFKELVHTGVFQDLSSYPICSVRGASAPDYEPQALVLKSLNWKDGSVNFNSKNRLSLQKKWQAFDLQVISAHPKILFRVLWPSFSSQRRGSIVQFLWMATDYKFLKSNMEKLGNFGTIWSITFAWVPLFCLIFWAYLIFLNRGNHSNIAKDRKSQIAISVFMLCMIFEYLFLEMGENQRYRMEIEPLLIMMGVTGCWNMFFKRQLIRSE
jgi:hypothetical protein